MNSSNWDMKFVKEAWVVFQPRDVLAAEKTKIMPAWLAGAGLSRGVHDCLNWQRGALGPHKAQALEFERYQSFLWNVDGALEYGFSPKIAVQSGLLNLFLPPSCRLE